MATTARTVTTVVQCNGKQCSTTRSNAMQGNAMKSNAKQWNAMQCNTKRCSAMQRNATGECVPESSTCGMPFNCRRELICFIKTLLVVFPDGFLWIAAVVVGGSAHDRRHAFFFRGSVCLCANGMRHVMLAIGFWWTSPLPTVHSFSRRILVDRGLGGQSRLQISVDTMSGPAWV